MKSVKMFWRAPWETGGESDDEYRSWLKAQEEISGFQRGEIQRRGSWVIIPYRVVRPWRLGIQYARRS